MSTITWAKTAGNRSTDKCALNRITPIAGEITALGVTINSGASFTFADVGTGTLMMGKKKVPVFKVVFYGARIFSRNSVSSILRQGADAIACCAGLDSIRRPSRLYRVRVRWFVRSVKYVGYRQLYADRAGRSPIAAGY